MIRATATLALCLSCAGAGASPPSASRASRTEVRIFASARRCDRSVDPSLLAILEEETPLVATAFHRAGMLAGMPLFDPSLRQLEVGATAVGEAPLVVVYSGHAVLADRTTGALLNDQEALMADPAAVRSVLCLRDRNLPVEELANRFGQPTTAAILIANACYSAQADIRQAKTNLSYIAGSTRRMAVSVAGTPIGRALIEALGESLDRDHDGHASDVELFAALDQKFSRAFGQPDPKLRRQVIGPTGFFPTRPSQSAYPIPDLDAPAEPSYFLAGRRYLRFPGRFSEESLRAASLPPDTRLQAVSCRQPIGQCFQIP